MSSVKEDYDRALEVANDLKLKNEKLIFVHAKLLEDFEHLKNGSRDIESVLTDGWVFLHQHRVIAVLDSGKLFI